MSELAPETLPAGFRAAGVAAGIKPSRGLDVGAVLSDLDETTSAVRFTRNALVAAPVRVCREAALGRLRAVVVNAGNANVGDGERGLQTARAMTEALAGAIGAPSERVGIASTGVIGVELPRARALAGIESALGELAEDGGARFAEAITTTDRAPKCAALEVTLLDGSVRLCAQAKGAGMISPAFATLLCFVESDAQVDAVTINRMLDDAVARSFERITVDGQLSTNDSVFAIANGASGLAVAAGSDDEWRFAAALNALLKQLALEVVADGEGATRVGRLVVRGNLEAVEPIARAVTNSPLVKTALAGGDPNWGRILQAAGQAIPDASAANMNLTIEGVEVARDGTAVSLDAEAERRLNEAMLQPEVEFLLELPDADDEAEIFFSDLTHDYVSLNSEYTT